MWGTNYKYKLALDSPKIYPVPTLVSFFTEKSIPVKHLECGGIHSLALDFNNNLYSWGCGSDGRLGHPEGEGYVYLYKEKKPKVIEKLRGRAEQVSSAYYTVMAIAKQE